MRLPAFSSSLVCRVESVICGFHCISPLTKDAPHFFTCSLAIHTASSAKYQAGGVLLSIAFFIIMEKEMAAHSSILAWRIPRTAEPVGYSPWGYNESDTTAKPPPSHLQF